MTPLDLARELSALTGEGFYVHARVDPFCDRCERAGDRIAHDLHTAQDAASDGSGPTTRRKSSPAVEPAQDRPTRPELPPLPSRWTIGADAIEVDVTVDEHGELTGFVPWTYRPDAPPHPFVIPFLFALLNVAYAKLADATEKVAPE